jgi:hypothetical protein
MDASPKTTPPVEHVLEQAYFHINNGGMTLSIIEIDHEGTKEYRFKHVLSSFAQSMESSFPLGNTDIVSWLTMALNRISMRVAGLDSERSWQPFESASVSVKDGMDLRQASMNLRIVDRFTKGTP